VFYCLIWCYLIGFCVLLVDLALIFNEAALATKTALLQIPQKS